MKHAEDERDLLDILFASRNRAYGAYQLRRNYPDAMRKALFFGLSGPVLLLFLGSWLSKRDFEKVKNELSRDVVIENKIKIEAVKPPEIEPISRPEPPRFETQRFVPPLPVPDEKVIDEPKIANIDDFKTAEVSTKTRAGLPSDGSEIFDEPRDLGEKSPTEIVKPVAPPEPLIFVERMPTFPGGDKALFAFFAGRVVYPTIARETGISGRVTLQFTVEMDGSISDVRAVKSPSKVLADEALRVARTMPNWSVGEQNGRAVRVRCTIPVVFELN